MPITLDFSAINMKMIQEVGGKNAALGEMFSHLAGKGVQVPDGFALTALAYRMYMESNGIDNEISGALAQLDVIGFSNLSELGHKVRIHILNGKWPKQIHDALFEAHQNLLSRTQTETTFAVRSSPTSKEFTSSDCAGKLDSYLNISGFNAVLEACQKCYASLFSDLSIKRRVEGGFEHLAIDVSVSVQHMVRSDLAVAGTLTTLNPENGNANYLRLSASYGLREGKSKGEETADQFLVFKAPTDDPLLRLVSFKLGSKVDRLVYSLENAAGGVPTCIRQTDPALRSVPCLAESDVLEIVKMGMTIEDYFGQPMEIEWAKDGLTQELFVVQARPFTRHTPLPSDTVSLTQIVSAKSGLS